MTTAPYGQEALSQIEQMGFTPAQTQAPQRLVVNLAGLEKAGKTHLALTGRSPIFIFSLDIGTEGVIEKFKRAGVEVFEYKIKIDKATTPGSEAEQHQVWINQWNDLKAKMSAVYDLNPGTVVLDTWTEAYELARLAHFGKIGGQPHQYPVVYSDLRSSVRCAYDHPTATSVFIHKMGPKFQSPEMEVKGFSDMDFLVQINLRNNRVDSEVPGSLPSFSTWIKDCRQNPFCNGYTLSGDQFSLQYLEWFVHQWTPAPSPNGQG